MVELMKPRIFLVNPEQFDTLNLKIEEQGAEEDQVRLYFFNCFTYIEMVKEVSWDLMIKTDDGDTKVITLDKSTIDVLPTPTLKVIRYYISSDTDEGVYYMIHKYPEVRLGVEAEPLVLATELITTDSHLTKVPSMPSWAFLDVTDNPVVEPYSLYCQVKTALKS